MCITLDISQDMGNGVGASCAPVFGDFSKAVRDFSKAVREFECESQCDIHSHIRI